MSPHSVQWSIIVILINNTHLRFIIGDLSSFSMAT